MNHWACNRLTSSCPADNKSSPVLSNNFVVFIHAPALFLASPSKCHSCPDERSAASNHDQAAAASEIDECREVARRSALPKPSRRPIRIKSTICPQAPLNSPVLVGIKADNLAFSLALSRLFRNFPNGLGLLYCFSQISSASSPLMPISASACKP